MLFLKKKAPQQVVSNVRSGKNVMIQVKVPKQIPEQFQYGWIYF